MSITSRFKFDGTVLVPKDKERFIRKWKGGRNNSIDMYSINFGIKENQNNVGYVTLFGMQLPVIKTISKDNKLIEIPWEDRDKEESKNYVASYRLLRVNLGEEFGGEHVFISEVDMINYLAENLPKYDGQIRVGGTWKKDAYQGNIRDKFEISYVFAQNEAVKPKLVVSMDLYYNEDSVDSDGFDEDKKIVVNGYVRQYVDKESGYLYYPQRAILSAEKYDMNKEMHVKKWNSRKRYLEDLPKKKMGHLHWEGRLLNGTEEVEFDESMLTEIQKEQIELGIRDLEFFKPKNAIRGNKVSEIRLTDPILLREFDEGYIKLDESLSDFEKEIFQFEPVKKEQLEDILGDTEYETEEDIDEIESLF